MKTGTENPILHNTAAQIARDTLDRLRAAGAFSTEEKKIRFERVSKQFEYLEDSTYLSHLCCLRIAELLKKEDPGGKDDMELCSLIALLRVVDKSFLWESAVKSVNETKIDPK